MPMKSNCIVSSSPSSPPKNFFWSLCGRLHLAEQDAVAGTPPDERAQLAEVRVRVVEPGELLGVDAGRSR